MAKDVEINVKTTGLKGLRDDLKAAKNEIIELQSQEVVDPVKLEAAIKRAGQLKDQFNDVNEQIKVFSGGSDFEKVSSGLGLIGSQLKSLDFEGAAQSAKVLTTTIKGLNPQTVATGFKALTSTVTQLGNAFFQMGLKLLANPIFLIVAVIAAVVIAIVLLKDKVKILEQAFDLLMAPINLLIEGLKELTDWIGITSFAEEEAAKKSEENAKRRIASNETVASNTEEFYARQIALAKANGKDTTDLEATALNARKKLADDSYQTTKKLINDRLLLLGIEKDEEISALIGRGAAVEEIEKSLNERRNGRTREQNKVDATFIFEQGKNLVKQYQDAANLGNQIGVLRAQNAKKIIDLEKQTANTIENIRINNLEDLRDKELQAADQSYKEKLQKDKDNINLTQKQRDSLEVAYLSELNKKIKDINKKYDKEELDQKLASDRAVVDARLAGLEEGFEKELAINEEINRRELEDIDRNEKLKGKAKEDAKIASDLKLANANQRSFDKEMTAQKAQNEKLLKERLDLEEKIKNARKDFDNYIIESTGTEYQKQITAIKNNVNERIKVQEDAETAEVAAYKARFDKEEQDTIEYLTGLSDIYEKYRGPDGVIPKIVEAGNKQTAEVKKTLFSKETSETLSNVTSILDSFNSLYQQIGAIADARDNERLKSIEKNQNDQNSLYDSQRQRELSQTNLSESQKAGINRKYDLLKYKADLAAFQKTEEIKKKQFARDKAFRIAGAVMDTASAAVKALNSGGNIYVGIVLAALATALGAAQIATISSQKYEGESGPSAPSLPSVSGGASEAATPNFNLFGSNRNAGEAQAPTTVNRRVSDEINVNVNVGVDEVTNTQNRVAKITRASQL